ncbi:MAG: HDOD domain-containing protein [Phycisphaerales bacterium]
MGSLSQILDNIDDVPALPDSAPALITALMAEEPNLKRIIEIIRRDEGLTTAILRRANSAAWGVPGRTFDIGQSVRRLGVRPLIRMALETQVGSGMLEAGTAYGLQRLAAWRGALFGGLAAEFLAETEPERTGGIEPGLAFSTGLLRDIGKLVIDQLVLKNPDNTIDPGAATAEAVDDVDGDAAAQGRAERVPPPPPPLPDTSFLEVERDRFGADHAALGAELATRWKLPDEMISAIAAHHEPAPPGDAAHSSLHDLIHAADTMSLWAGLAIGHDGLRYPVATHVQRGLLRSPRRVESWMAEVWTRYGSVTSELDPQATDANANSGSLALALNGSLAQPTRSDNPVTAPDNGSGDAPPARTPDAPATPGRNAA